MRILLFAFICVTRGAFSWFTVCPLRLRHAGPRFSYALSAESPTRHSRYGDGAGGRPTRLLPRIALCFAVQCVAVLCALGVEKCATGRAS